MRLKSMAGVFAGVWLCLVGVAQAASLTLTITNNTDGMYFKELLIAAHTPENLLFESGYPATAGLEELAECGRQATLLAAMGEAKVPAVVIGVEECPALGFLAPRASVTCTVDVDDEDNMMLSIAGRLMASNDGFVGLEAMEIPVVEETYSFDLIAFDASTEANTEVLGETIGECSVTESTLPDLPGGNGGVNGTGAAGGEFGVGNNNIHVHRGVLGDNDLVGGISDLDPRFHRWTNPIGTVTVIVQ